MALSLGEGALLIVIRALRLASCISILFIFRFSIQEGNPAKEKYGFQTYLLIDKGKNVCNTSR